MSVLLSSGWSRRFGVAALALFGLGVATLQPVLAQSRTIASLGDVPTVMPTPYHPHTATAVYSSALYDGYPYYGRAHYWH
jgi:hypothetical protein